MDMGTFDPLKLGFPMGYKSPYNSPTGPTYLLFTAPREQKWKFQKIPDFSKIAVFLAMAPAPKK